MSATTSTATPKREQFPELRLVLSQLWRLWASPDAKIGDEIGVLSLYNTSSYDVQMNGDFFVAAYNKPRSVEFKLICDCLI
jgi:hypothetical protein